MGVIKKQTFQSSILIYAGTLIGFLTTGLMMPNLLTKSEIGTLRLLQSYSSLFMSLGILGFSTITIRFLPRFYDKIRQHYNGFLGISLIVGVVGSIIACSIIFGIKPMMIENNLEKSPQFAQYFILIIPLTIFQIFYILLDSYNNALFHSSFGVFLRDFVQRILILIGLALILMHFIEFDQYIYYFIAVLCFPTILMLLHIVWHKNFDININFRFLRKPLISSMASVGVFGILNSFGSIAVIQIDTIMLNMYVNSAVVGIYAITFYFGTLVLIPMKALNKIAPTLIARAYKEKDLETVQDVYNKSTANLFLIGTLILLGLMVNLENVFHIIPKTFEEGKYVIVLIGFANLLKMSGGSNDSVIMYSRYFKMTTLFLVFHIILLVILNLIFIPTIGMIGAALASMLAIFIHNLIKFVFIKIKFGFNPYNAQFLLVVSLSIVIYFIVSVLPDLDNYIVEILVDSIITSLLFYIILRFVPIASEMRELIHQIFERAIKLFHSKNN